MREIKFNVYDKTTDTYYKNAEYDFNIDFGSKTIAITIREGYSEIVALDYEKEIECVLLQYTGLKDKNGKEIYEGDILCVSGYSYEEPEDDWTGEVAMGTLGWGILGFNSCVNNDFYYLSEIGGSYTTIYETQGNKYRNADLLKE